MGDLIKEGKIRHWGLSNETTYGMHGIAQLFVPCISYQFFMNFGSCTYSFGLGGHNSSVSLKHGNTVTLSFCKGHCRLHPGKIKIRMGMSFMSWLYFEPISKPSWAEYYSLNVELVQLCLSEFMLQGKKASMRHPDLIQRGV